MLMMKQIARIAMYFLLNIQTSSPEVAPTTFLTADSFLRYPHSNDTRLNTPTTEITIAIRLNRATSEPAFCSF